MRVARIIGEVCGVLVSAIVVEIALRTARLPRAARWCGLQLDLQAPPAPAVLDIRAPLPARARRSWRATDVVMTHWPWGDTCLRRCLVLGRRLRRFDPVLRIGVARTADGSVVAHAWLEVAGRTLDPSAADYCAFGAAP